MNIVTNLMVAYDHLCDSINLINDCYGFKYLVEIGTTTAFTIFSIFGSTHFIIKASAESAQWLPYFTNIVWNILYLYYLIFIIFVSHFVINEGKKTGVLMQKIFKYGDMIYQINIFTQSVTHRRPVIATPFFDIDLSNFLSIHKSQDNY